MSGKASFALPSRSGIDNHRCNSRSTVESGTKSSTGDLWKSWYRLAGYQTLSAQRESGNRLPVRAKTSSPPISARPDKFRLGTSMTAGIWQIPEGQNLFERHSVWRWDSGGNGKWICILHSVLDQLATDGTICRTHELDPEQASSLVMKTAATGIKLLALRRKRTPSSGGL